MSEAPRISEACDDTACIGHYEFSSYCGVKVCIECNHHKGLARCYCGWSATGGDGKRELVEMGETIDEE